MRYCLIIIIVFITQRIYSQTPLDTIGFPIKKAYKICSHSKQDTTFSYFFQYNSKHQLIRFEKIKKGESLNYLKLYKYDSLGRRITEEIHAVFRYSDSNYSDQSKWAKDIIGVYGRDNTYHYDTLNKVIIANIGVRAINYQNYDSVFKDNKLIGLYDKNDSTTFEYDRKGRLLYERTNKYNKKTLKKYKYKNDDIYIFTYNINTKKQLIKTTYLKYINNNLVQKNEIEKEYFQFNKWKRPKPINYYCNTTYFYENNRLMSFKQERHTCDNGADECGANFIEIYKYE